MGTMITLRAEDGHNFQAYKARHQGNRREHERELHRALTPVPAEPVRHVRPPSR